MNPGEAKVVRKEELLPREASWGAGRVDWL